MDYFYKGQDYIKSVERLGSINPFYMKLRSQRSNLSATLKKLLNWLFKILCKSVKNGAFILHVPQFIYNFKQRPVDSQPMNCDIVK